VAPRSATATIAGTTVVVTQAARPTYTYYLAEGAASDLFDTRLALLNPGDEATTATLALLRTGTEPVRHEVVVPARTRRTVWPRELPGIEGSAFSTVVTADRPLVVDRTMTWDHTGYGAHAETATPAPSSIWYLAEGATHSGFDLFYLLQNPTHTPATVRVQYLRAGRPPLQKDYLLEPLSRSNIWVNMEEFSGLGLALASDECSAVFESLDGTPIIVERAMYRSSPGRVFTAGHASLGVRAPSTRWFLAEGATGPYFDQFVLIANPAAVSAQVRVSYLLDGGQTYSRNLVIPARSRETIWVDREEFPGIAGLPLEDVAVSTTIESTNGVALIVERSMWWPGDASTWHEAHNAAGATETAPGWALAEGEVGGPRDAETYILMANTSVHDGSATVTLLFEDGTSASQVYDLPARARVTAAIASDFGAVVQGRRFGALVESTGATPMELVVERAMYSNADGVVWAAGTSAAATRLP
jgi:hypothetical protein